jgi:hypothetical protein
MADQITVASAARGDGLDIVVRGRLPAGADDGVVTYLAASPPDRRSSFSGSALPFADARQAFDRTPNRGQLQLGPDRDFEVRLKYPNAYYAGLGTVYVPPSLILEFVRGGERMRSAVKISDGAPFRTLTYPRLRTSASFYAPATAQPVATQEQILRASAYPATNKEPADFWGGKPPL